MNETVLQKMLLLAEQFFGTENDPEQIPITEESFHKLQALHPQSLIYKMDGDDPVSWIVVVPTSKNVADKFLQGEITERELLEMSEPQAVYDALYLCSAFTIPEYRNRGYVVEMCKEAFEAIPHTADVQLFAWPYSKEGSFLIKKLESALGEKIELKK